MFITARIRRMGKVIFSLCVSVHTSTGGWGKGPRSQIFRRGSPVSDFLGGVPGLRFSGGGSQSQILGGGGGGSPVSIKEKNFDTRFGLIHVQTRKIFFVEGPPPPSKGENF